MLLINQKVNILARQGAATANASLENRFTALFTTGNIAGDLRRIEHLEKTVKNDADAAEANCIMSCVILGCHKMLIVISYSEQFPRPSNAVGNPH